MLTTVPSPFRLETQGRTNALYPMPSTAGPINYRSLVKNLQTQGFNPKDGDRWIADLNAGALSLDHLNLREQYEGRIVRIDPIQRLSAAENNETNSFLYTRICPLFLTTEFNFGYTSSEVYMIPFDRMDPLNVARTTTATRKNRSFTLSSFKRAQEAEMLLLADPLFGPEHLRVMRDTIDKQASLTFMMIISTALPDEAYMNKIMRTNHPIHAMSHMRELIMEDRETFIGNDPDPSRLLHVIATRVNDINRITDVIIPQGFGARIITWQGEPGPAGTWIPTYETSQRAILLKAYSDGAMTFKTVPVSNGRFLNVFELQKFIASAEDSETSAVQPLRGILTFGEIIRDRAMTLVELRDSGQALNAKRLDMKACNQTQLRITVDMIHYGKKARSCIMFLDKTGKTLDKPDDNLSDIYMSGLVKEYAGQEDDFMNAFRKEENLSNDNIDPTFLEQDTTLEQAKMFRHYDAFMTYVDNAPLGNRIQPPRFWGDVEPKTMPPEDAGALAEILVRESGLEDQSGLEAVYNVVLQISEYISINRRAIKISVVGALGAPYNGINEDTLATQLIALFESASDLTAILTKSTAMTAIANVTAAGTVVDNATFTSQLRTTITNLYNTAKESGYPAMVQTIQTTMRALKTYLPNSNVYKYLSGNHTLAEKRAFVTALVGDDRFDFNNTDAVVNGHPVPGRIVGTVNAVSPALFAAPLASHFNLTANEQLHEYKSRVGSKDQIIRAVEDGSLGAVDSIWIKMLQHIPDESIADFSVIMHTVLSKPQLTAEDAEGLHAMSEMLESESRSAVASKAINRISRALPQLNPEKQTIGSYLNGLARNGWLTPETMLKVQSLPVPIAQMAHIVESHIDAHAQNMSLGSVATIGAGGDTNVLNAAGAAAMTADEFRARAEQRYSWQTYEGYRRQYLSVIKPPMVQLFYVAFLQSRVNFHTVHTLAQYGIPLMQINGLRLCIYQQADSVILTAAGPEIMKLGVGHGQVTSGINAGQSVYTMHAMMFCGMIIQKPECIDIIPHAIATEYLGGRNLEAIRTINDVINVQNALDRRSVIYVAQPLNERRFEFPLSIFREPIYGAPNNRTNMFVRKVSFTDSLRLFIGLELLQKILGFNTQNAAYYAQPISMATHVHDACVWLPNNLHPEVLTMEVVPGTGPLGVPERNVPKARDAYAGLSSFPNELPVIMSH